MKLNPTCPTIGGVLPLPEIPGQLWFGGLYEDAVDREQVFQELEHNGVSVIWNLLDSGRGCERERARFAHVIWTPIVDYDVPDDDEAFLRDLDQVIDCLLG